MVLMLFHVRNDYKLIKAMCFSLFYIWSNAKVQVNTFHFTRGIVGMKPRVSHKFKLIMIQ